MTGAAGATPAAEAGCVLAVRYTWSLPGWHELLPTLPLLALHSTPGPAAPDWRHRTLKLYLLALLRHENLFRSLICSCLLLYCLYVPQGDYHSQRQPELSHHVQGRPSAGGSRGRGGREGMAGRGHATASHYPSYPPHPSSAVTGRPPSSQQGASTAAHSLPPAGQPAAAAADPALAQQAQPQAQPQQRSPEGSAAPSPVQRSGAAVEAVAPPPGPGGSSAPASVPESEQGPQETVAPLPPHEDGVGGLGAGKEAPGEDWAAERAEQAEAVSARSASHAAAAVAPAVVAGLAEAAAGAGPLSEAVLKVCITARCSIMHYMQGSRPALCCWAGCA